MPNLIPQMSSEDKAIITDFVRSKSEASMALRRLIDQYMEHFRDIRNIDLHENVGLQTCSHMRAYDMLEEIFTEIELCEKKMPQKSAAAKSFR